MVTSHHGDLKIVTNTKGLPNLLGCFARHENRFFCKPFIVRITFQDGSGAIIASSSGGRVAVSTDSKTVSSLP